MIVVHLMMKAVCFWNIMFVSSATMENVQIHIRYILHVAPLSKNYSVQLNSVPFLTNDNWQDSVNLLKTSKNNVGKQITLLKMSQRALL
jgi:hypothetical protein